MISKALKRALIDTKLSLPPAYLLPWIATLEPAATKLKTKGVSQGSRSFTSQTAVREQHTEIFKDSDSINVPVQATRPELPLPNSSKLEQSSVSSSVRELLPLLHAQGQHYITAHIHGFPYLVTQGDTLRLPFYMHGVQPGDVLRLNCASIIGSRDYTLKASAALSLFKITPTPPTEIIDNTTGIQPSTSRVMPAGSLSSTPTTAAAPHYVPHIAKGKISYVDDRLFVCRATVMGVESEPLRVKEKTKRRQRRVKTVKSKHRYTILKVKELRVRTLEEIEAEETQ